MGNTMYLSLSLLSFTAAVVYGQRPKPCAAPPLFEGKISTFIHVNNLSRHGKFYYDAQNERTRLQETFVSRGRKIKYDILTLYKKDLEYLVNLETGECFQNKCLPPFRPVLVPANATFLGEAYIGRSYPVQIWGGTLPGGNSFYSVWSSDGSCIPITITTVLSVDGFTTNTYFDITRGISDPTIWYKPPQCP